MSKTSLFRKISFFIITLVFLSILNTSRTYAAFSLYRFLPKFLTTPALTPTRTPTPTRIPTRTPTPTKTPIGVTVKPIVLANNLKEVFLKGTNNKFPVVPVNFGAYVISSIGDQLYLGLSACSPGNCDGSLLVRYSNGITESILNKDSEGKNYNIVSEQGLHRMVVENNTLYIAGTDPVEDPATEWSKGNIYTYQPDGQIIKIRNLSKVLHTLGLMVENGVIYVAAGSYTGEPNGDKTTWLGKILKSTDNGQTWRESVFSDNRAWDIIRYKGILYAHGTYGGTMAVFKKSVDDGLTWTDLGRDNIPSNFNRLQLFNEAIVYAGNAEEWVTVFKDEGVPKRFYLPDQNFKVARYFNVTTTDKDGWFYVINHCWEGLEPCVVMRSKDLTTWYLVANLEEQPLAIHYWENKNMIVVSGRGEKGRLWGIDLNQATSLPVVTPIPTRTPAPTPTSTIAPTPTPFPVVVSKEGKIELSSFSGIDIANPDGSNQQNIVSWSEISPNYQIDHKAYNPRDASWSIDGKEMVFVAYRFDSNQFKSYWKLMSKSYSEGKITSWLPEQPAGVTISSPHFSPDRKELYFSMSTIPDSYGNSHKGIYKLTRGSQVAIPVIPPPSGGDYLLRDISNDGTKLMYYLTGYGSSSQNEDIFIANIDGSNSKDITNTPGIQELYPGFSPDGSKIIYRKFNSPNGTYDLYTMNTNGTNNKILIESADYDEGTACYSPDGTKIIYGFSTKATPYQYGLFIINTDGSGRTKVMNLNNNRWLNMHCWAPDPNYTGPTVTPGATVIPMPTSTPTSTNTPTPTLLPPLGVAIITPTPGGADDTVTIEWTNPGGTVYWFQASTGNNKDPITGNYLCTLGIVKDAVTCPGSQQVQGDGITSTNGWTASRKVTLKNLSCNTTYYVHIRASTDSNSTPWSPDRLFKTPPCPANAPVPTNPPVATNPDKFYPRVFLLVYNPILEKKGGVRLNQYLNLNNPYLLADSFITEIKNDSYGLMNYKIVGSKEIDDYPLKQDGFQYADESYLECWRDKTLCHGFGAIYGNPDIANYNKILTDQQICEMANANYFDELWMIAAPWFGFWEANMAGPGGFRTNGPVIYNTTCTKPQHIMGFTNHTPIDNMMENYAHRSRGTFDTFINVPPNSTGYNWNQFKSSKRYNPTAPFVGCGEEHFPPNTLEEYNVRDTTPVNSNCDDWLNYPNFKGEPQGIKEINCNAWECTAAGFFRWWLKHFPHVGGIDNLGKYNSWWNYISTVQANLIPLILPIPTSMLTPTPTHTPAPTSTPIYSPAPTKTPTSTPTPFSYLPSSFGQSIVMDGKTNYLEISNSNNLQPQLGFTAEAWFKPSIATYSARLINKFNDSQYSYNLFINSIHNTYYKTYDLYYQFGVADAALNCSYNFASKSLKISETEPSKITSWQHLAGVIQPDGRLEIYLNGEKVASSSALTQSMCTRDIPINIGGKNSNLTPEMNGFFPGLINEFRISSTARYQNNFTLPSSPFVTDNNTQVLYHFNGNLDDSSGNNHNAVSYGPISYVGWILYPTRSPTPTSMPTASPQPTGFIRLIQPNGGETLTAGDTYEIKWEQNLINNVNIGVKTCTSCLDWIAISLPISSPTGTYNWFIPNSLAGQNNVQIEVFGYQINVGTYTDYSDNTFRIIAKPTSTPTITSTPSPTKTPTATRTPTPTLAASWYPFGPKGIPGTDWNTVAKMADKLKAEGINVTKVYKYDNNSYYLTAWKDLSFNSPINEGEVYRFKYTGGDWHKFETLFDNYTPVAKRSYTLNPSPNTNYISISADIVNSNPALTMEDLCNSIYNQGGIPAQISYWEKDTIKYVNHKCGTTINTPRIVSGIGYSVFVTKQITWTLPPGSISSPTPTATPTPFRIPPILSSLGKIVFSSGSEISMMNPDGSNIQKIYQTAETGVYSAGYPSLSFDGRYIVFAGSKYDSFENSTYYNIFIKELNTGIVRKLLPNDEKNNQISYPLFSPDGKSIFFSKKVNNKFKIFKIDIAGGTVTTVINPSGSTGDYMLGSISPDGSKLLYVPHNAGTESGTDDVFIANIDGSNRENLTKKNVSGRLNLQHFDPAFSSDGKSIVYRAGSNLEIMDLNLKTTRKVVGNDGMDQSKPSFSPDGSRIVYLAAASPSYIQKIYMVNTDGTGKTLIYDYKSNPIYTIAQHSWAPDPNYTGPTVTPKATLTPAVTNTPVPTLTSIPTITPTPTTTYFYYSFGPGGKPGQDWDTAMELLNKLNSYSGINATEISRFIDSKYSIYILNPSSDNNNFEIKAGEGYIIKYSGSRKAFDEAFSNFTAMDYLEYNLPSGWSLISFPDGIMEKLGSNTADSLCKKLSGKISQIGNYPLDSKTGLLNTYTCGGKSPIFTNFIILPGRSYMINSPVNHIFIPVLRPTNTPTITPTQGVPTGMPVQDVPTGTSPSIPVSTSSPTGIRGTSPNIVAQTEKIVIDTIKKAIGAVSQPSPTPISAPASTVPTGTPTPCPRIPGDVNCDGRADGVDYIIMMRNNGKRGSGGTKDGDFNGDGVVNGSDIEIWKNNISF